MELKDEFAAGDDLGIDFEEKAFYDILKSLQINMISLIQKTNCFPC